MNQPLITGQQYQDALYEDLHAQLCCAWEEWVEQHMEADQDRPAAMKASHASSFHGAEIMVIGHDRTINHYRFKLERLG